MSRTARLSRTMLAVRAARNPTDGHSRVNPRVAGSSDAQTTSRSPATTRMNQAMAMSFPRPSCFRYGLPLVGRPPRFGLKNASGEGDGAGGGLHAAAGPDAQLAQGVVTPAADFAF